MSAKRFCFITANTTSLSGASELLWSQCAELLRAQGHVVTVLIPDIPGEPTHLKSFIASGGKVLRYGTFRKGLIHRLKYKLNGGGGPLEKLAREGVDLVFISQGGAFDGLDWVKQCQLYQLPFATISHAVRRRVWPNDELCDELLKNIPSALANFFVSRGNLELFERQLGGKVTNAMVIPQEFTRASGASLAWPSEEVLKLACVARIDPADKGQDIFLDVLMQPKWKQRPIVIDLIGDSGSFRSFKRTIERLGLQDKLRMVGYNASVTDVWSTHHGLILPSRDEGQSLAVLEAMDHERMVVTTDVGDNAELVRDGVTGYLMKGPSAAEMERALELVWENRTRLQAMGKEAKRVLAAHYSQTGLEFTMQRLSRLSSNRSSSSV